MGDGKVRVRRAYAMGVKFWKKVVPAKLPEDSEKFTWNCFFVEDTTGVTPYKSMVILRDFLYNSALFGLGI